MPGTVSPYHSLSSDPHNGLGGRQVSHHPHPLSFNSCLLSTYCTQAVGEALGTQIRACWLRAQVTNEETEAPKPQGPDPRSHSGSKSGQAPQVPLLPFTPQSPSL